MEMILLDWTRMGTTYCVAGAITQNGQMRVVRPLWVRHRQSPVRNVGWTPFVMDGHSRWEIFELVGPEPAVSQPPHSEDVWVRDLKPTRRLATGDQRRAVGEDPYQPKKSDGPGVGAWRQRMGTETAKETYKLRAATAEWVNAGARQRGMVQATVRGRQKVLAVALLQALVHNLRRTVALRAAQTALV
jgi:Transposase DDE domain